MRSQLSPQFLTVLIAFGCSCNQGPQAPAGPVGVVAPQTKADPPVPLPNKSGTVKFAVLGDFGSASAKQYETATAMVNARKLVPFEFVVTVGDNLYGSERPQDFAKKFEQPYKPLLDAGVKFYAALGNHDDRNQRYYKLFNMDGKLYYSMKPSVGNVKFFLLDTTYPDPDQVKWIEDELKGSKEDWKIPVFHHPLYSSGSRHGSDLRLRETLEPLFIKYDVSVVFTGHDHFYERVKPQKGISYFVVGSGGQLRAGNLDNQSGITARGFDSDYAFMVCEIDGDKLHFNAISRTGDLIDSGIILRRQPPE